MPDIKTGTLVVCIQAVAAEIRTLQEIVQSGEAEIEDYQTLEDWRSAAEDLEAAYDSLSKTHLNLLPYDELTAS